MTPDDPQRLPPTPSRRNRVAPKQRDPVGGSTGGLTPGWRRAQLRPTRPWRLRPWRWPRDEASRHVPIAVLAVLAVCGLIASPAPTGMVPLILQQTLFLGAAGSAAVAFAQRQAVTARHFTFWDVCLVLLLASLTAGQFVDPDALSLAMEQLAVQAD